MRRLSPEFRIIFAEEFRRQVRRPGFAFFVVLIPLLLVIAIPLTPFVVDMIEEDIPDQTIEVGDNPLATAGYVDSAGVLPGAGSQDTPKSYGDRALSTKAIEQGEIEPLFVIPVAPV